MTKNELLINICLLKNMFIITKYYEKKKFKITFKKQTEKREINLEFIKWYIYILRKQQILIRKTHFIIPVVIIYIQIII